MDTVTFLSFVYCSGLKPKQHAGGGVGGMSVNNFLFASEFGNVVVIPAKVLLILMTELLLLRQLYLLCFAHHYAVDWFMFLQISYRYYLFCFLSISYIIG